MAANLLDRAFCYPLASLWHFFGDRLVDFARPLFLLMHGDSRHILFGARWISKFW